MPTEEQCYAKHEEINNKLNEIKLSIARLPAEIFSKADDRFATKITQTIVYTMLATIFFAVLGSLVSTVVKAFN